MGKRLRGRGGIVFLFLLSLFVGSCKREEGERAKEPFRGVNVEVREVRRGNIPDVVTFVANLEPRQRTAIIPKVSGLIEKIYVREGDYVRKGDLLVSLKNLSTTLWWALLAVSAVVLFTSTLITLIFVPTLYYMMEKRRR